MNDDSTTIFAAVVFIAIAFIGGGVVASDIWKDEAVKHHKAVYYLYENNHKQWKWEDER